MFVYSPDSHKEQLREKFSQKAPSFKERTGRGGRVPSWNWIIAPGRVFSSGDDFELFLDGFCYQGLSLGHPRLSLTDCTSEV